MNTAAATPGRPAWPARSPGLGWALAGAVLASLGVRVWLALRFPITGDEAFFYGWGVYPAWGYSDHPPMVGWWLAAMRAFLGDGPLALRLPAVLLPSALTALVGWALWPQGRRAAWAMLLVALAPLHWLDMLITTDTPLVFFSALSLACLLRAEQRERLDGVAWALYAASGLAWSCAFLSKYFAVLLAAAMGLALVGRRERWPAYGLLALCALPGPLQNLLWNMDHGWPNILFNVFNRHDDARLTWQRPALYLLTWAYLLTPALLWLLWRWRAAVREGLARHRLLNWVLAVPLAVFALVSLRKSVGLHWLLSFYPWVLAWLAMTLPRPALPGAARGLALFTALHLLAVAGLALSTLPQWQTSRWYPDLVRGFHMPQLLQRLDRPGTVLMAEAYTPAALYGYGLGRYVPVFGVGGFHARQDDLWVDFSVYEGRTLRIVHRSAPELARYAPYFDAVSAEVVELEGARFHVLEGRGFHYEPYRREVLAEIDRRYHRVPHWLPMTGCPFCERLCGQVRCAP